MRLNRFRSELGVSIKVFLLVLLAVSFVAVFHVKFVRAAPLTMSVVPASAPVGSAVNISGVDASAGGEVRFYVQDYLFLGSTVANASGGYSFDLSVPAVPMGVYSIMALDVASGDTVSTMFGVEPRVILTPSVGGYRDEVSVRGDGFNSDSDVWFTFDGSDVSPSPLPHTDFSGSFTGSFYVPSRMNGTYDFAVDDEWGASVSVLFDVAPKLMLWPTSGAALTIAFVEGYGFAPVVDVALRFGLVDVTPYPYVTTAFDGSFGVPFFVPDLPDGVYTVNATDDAGLTSTAAFVIPGPILTLTPDRTSDSSVVTARGLGFQSGAPILLYLEDITMTSLIDLMLTPSNLQVAEDGSFEYTFIVPVTSPGAYTVEAYMMPGPSPAEPVKLASASLTIVDDSSLQVGVNVGSLHFRGEIAEFYVETSFGGKPIDAVIDSVKLYWNGTLKQDLLSSVTRVTTGLYRVPYSIPADAAIGTYNLVVEAEHTDVLVEAFGTGSGSFLLSAGFTDQRAMLIDVQGKIGTIIVPDLGVIKANLTSINAMLIGIDGKEVTIQSDIGVLKADADTINARVTSIDGNLATVVSDLGTVKIQTTPHDAPDYQNLATLILSFFAAVGATLSLVHVRKIKPATPAPTPTVSQPPETPPPATPTKPNGETEASATKDEAQPETPPATPPETPPSTSDATKSGTETDASQETAVVIEEAPPVPVETHAE